MFGVSKICIYLLILKKLILYSAFWQYNLYHGFHKHINSGVQLWQYTPKNKGTSKGSSSHAIEEPFLVPQRTIQSKGL